MRRGGRGHRARSCSAANFNSPEQTVIAGTAAGVAKAGEILKAKGAKRVLPLPVSAPFHCALMKPAEEALSPFLDARGVRARSRSPSSTTPTRTSRRTPPRRARPCAARSARPCAGSSRVQRLSALADSAIEVGPGTVLAGLARRIAKDWPVKTTSTAAALDALA